MTQLARWVQLVVRYDDRLSVNAPSSRLARPRPSVMSQSWRHRRVIVAGEDAFRWRFVSLQCVPSSSGSSVTRQCLLTYCRRGAAVRLVSQFIDCDGVDTSSSRPRRQFANSAAGTRTKPPPHDKPSLRQKPLPQNFARYDKIFLRQHPLRCDKQQQQ